MKNQYVGDIGDYGKYGLLRFLSHHDIRIGVNWYLTENDGSTDGKHVSYLEKNSNRICDPELFDTLKKIAHRTDKTVHMIEDASVIPGAEYYNEGLQSRTLKPDARKISRRLWFNNSTLLLQDADLIFADPDNGLSFTKKATVRDSEKFVLPEEIAEYYNSGKDVVYYCQKGRRTPEEWEQAKTGILRFIPDAMILVLTFHRGKRRSNVFVVHPRNYAKYDSLLTEFLETDWNKMFFREEAREIENYIKPYPSRKISGLALEPLKLDFTVCKVADYSGINIDQPFVFTGRTDTEKSLVCPTEMVPGKVISREDGWKAFRICGKLDFSLIGILAEITEVLAKKRIGVFAVSTYDTDYVLTKSKDFSAALDALQDAGWILCNRAERIIGLRRGSE